LTAFLTLQGLSTVNLSVNRDCLRTIFQSSEQAQNKS
jgi:hypothetical protein